MTHTGWRKPTPGLGMAQHYAQVGERISVSKSRAFVALKRVGAHVGLKAGDMLLLDTLAAFTQAQDWDEGQRPIVWASNAYLMGQTGFSLSALKRHARKLAELGIISFQDSPNGKRWGRRDPEGRIIEAYGFDLSPLAARAEEFEALHADLQTERAICQRLKRQITVARRSIRARLETALSAALNGPWDDLGARYQDLLDTLSRKPRTKDQIDRLCHLFHELEEQIETFFHRATCNTEAVENPPKADEEPDDFEMVSNPKGTISEPHLRTTNQLEPVIRNFYEHTESKPEQENQTPTRPEIVAQKDDQEKTLSCANLEAATILQACPEFASWARNIGAAKREWSDLHRIAGQLGPMIGLSQNTWNQAQTVLGHRMATAAFALVFDKHCAGEISAPGGYLRGMVKKAGAGALHLQRSFYGRLAAQAAL